MPRHGHCIYCGHRYPLHRDASTRTRPIVCREHVSLLALDTAPRATIDHLALARERRAGQAS